MAESDISEEEGIDEKEYKRGKISVVETMLDIIKWGVILIIAGCIFYYVCPKYDFDESPKWHTRYNKITGTMHLADHVSHEWVSWSEWNSAKQKD